MSGETGPFDPLRLAASRTPDAPAVDAPGGVWSYGELDRAADRVASALRPWLARPRPAAADVPRIGTTRPDAARREAAEAGVDTEAAVDAEAARPPVMAAFLPPTPEAVAALHGVPRTGAALAPLHPEWKPPELAGILSRLRPIGLVVTEATRVTAGTALALSGLEPARIDLDEAAPDPGAAADAEADPSATDPDASASPASPTRNDPSGPYRIHTVLSTSGSSGRPRLVALTAANHEANARGVISRLGLRSGDRWLASLSFAHVGGLAMAMRAAVAGSTLVLHGRFDAARWWRELETARITHVSLVPTMLRRLLEVAGDRPVPSRLTCALLGGAATDPALLDRALERNWPVALTYGLTEAGSQVATAEPERVRRKPGTVGPPLPGVELRIEEGEVLVGGPVVMAGYWDGPDDELEDGWLRTGDLGRLDDEGDLWIVGRRSARIVTGGVNVDPAEVEAVLLSHPGVSVASVLGVPDAEWGERVVAAVEPAERAESAEYTEPAELAAALERLCRERLAAPKRPKAFHVVDPMPRTPSGKPDREGVRERIRELERGREQVRQREWVEAFRSLARADEADSLGVDDLESLALAAYMVGRDPEYLDALARAHHACLEADDGLRAARFGFWIGLRLLLRGDAGPATGWLRRARRLVDAAEGPCVEEGYLLLPDAERELAAGEPRAAEATAAHAVEIGDRFTDADLTAAARHVQGRALIARGAVDEGLALLDEAMVAVAAGEVSPLLTGLIYCSVIETCQRVCAFRRAREWTAALADWCDRQPQMVAFTSTCLVHRAEVMRWHGEWPAAIAEARRARDLFARGIEPRPPAAAFYQQAEVHRLRGEFEAAEQGYRDASEWGRDPQPGLSLLRLAQGRVEAALAGLERALEATSDPPARARLLSAYVEISLAAGEIDGARQAVRELEEIADRFDTEVLGAMAAGAAGALHLEEGDVVIALESLRRAREVWERVEAPYRIARVRELVGRACRRVGDDDGARMELDAARVEYERLGATPDLARLETLAGASPPQAAHPLTPRQLEVLRLVAAGKTNKEVAAELGLSERTIERHVSNILRRLRVSSRVAATAYAYEHDLIPRG